MTKLLEGTLAEISRLSKEDPDSLAKCLLAELECQRRNLTVVPTST